MALKDAKTVNGIAELSKTSKQIYLMHILILFIIFNILILLSTRFWLKFPVSAKIIILACFDDSNNSKLI